MEELRGDDGSVKVAVGDEIEARVVELGDKAGSVVLRKLMRKGAELRGELQSAFELGVPVEGTVTAVNKGGVEVMIAGVRAFCPVSQLELRQVEDASVYIGRKLAFKITKHEADRRGVNLVVSRRALLEEEARGKAAVTREKLVVGAVLPGVVVAIKDFGAFVDIGGIEGMLPASELGFARGQKPSEVLTVGQPLEVQVLRLEKTDDPRRPERISLSLKSLSRDPWDDVPTRYAPGTKLTGKVAKVEVFGAFVELEPGIEGLVHISEMSGEKSNDGKPRSVRHAREAMKPGESHEVTVLSIDRERRRISLGLGDRTADIEPADLEAAARLAAPGKLGTFADLFNARKRS
jgi:small subunit ribosomal protein S1